MGNSARLYVELIRRATGGTWANWAPTREVNVGDYGLINKETGEFEKEGNIYDQKFNELDFDIGHEFPIRQSPPDDKQVITSRGFKQAEMGATASLGFDQVGANGFKGSWSITRGRGAIVVMYQPAERSIDGQPQLLPRLRHVGALENKALVTSVYSCPMYALLLTDDAKNKVTAAVGLNVPAHGGGSANGHWHTWSSSGVWKSGGAENIATFFPLFTLRTPNKKSHLDALFGRREAADVSAEDAFPLYQPPWELLDLDTGDELPPDESDEE